MPKKAFGQGKPVRKKEDSWLSDDVQTNTGLPPQVYGQVRCFCKLTVSQVVWTIPKPPDLTLVRVKWWGEEGDGILFRPVDVKKGNKVGCQTTARYPVRSGPCQFATYLSDMGSLMLDVLTGPDSQVIGQATITQIGLLTNTRPINGFFPVVSGSGQKLANLQVSVVLEPLLASYDNLGTIPTTDISLENGRTYDSVVQPVNSQPLPYSDIPRKPETTVFISPTAVHEGHKGQTELGKTHLESGLRQQLDFGLPSAQANLRHEHRSTTGAVAITTNGDVVSLPASKAIGSRSEHLASSSLVSSRNPGLKSPARTSRSADKDLLSVLVEKGTKLREAMIVSSMNANQTDSLMKTSPEKANNYMFAPSNSATEAGDLANAFIGMSGSGLDILSTSPIRNQDFQLYSLLNGMSPGSSVSSDMGHDQGISDMEDPVYQNSMLQELIYHHSDNDGVAALSGYENSDYMHYMRSPDHRFRSLPPRLLGGGGGHSPLEAAGNQRPPSRTSSLTSLNLVDPVETELGATKGKRSKRRARSSSRSSSRSQSRSRSNTPRRTDTRLKTSNVKDVAANVVKETKAVKPKKKTRSRSNSRSRSRSRPRRRKTSADGASDSDQLSSAFSENAKERNKHKTDGLSVERLTLLGRVHVARVDIESLQLSHSVPDYLESKLPVSKFKAGKPPRPQKSKKLSTYFVEYQFPVVTTTRNKYAANAVATELTRVASKNVKDGVVAFNHRSVFPIMFDGAAVERWWKSALVFRLYCREEVQQMPVLMGSGGISLKSVLRSDNLCVKREIEIQDTSRSNLHNNSQTSSLDSSASARSNASIFGILKVSVELASDHKEFPTILARTKLAEMSGKVKVVSIGGEQARIVEEHNRNKDQPVIKSPTKKIDIPGIMSQPITTTAVTGLPPQSPRRKMPDPTSALTEDSDEISKLKQQLQATLAALSNPKPQRPSGTHLDAGTNVFGGQRESESTTLHTLLLIQEGRNITLHGVPPLQMANRYPGLLQAKPETAGRDAVTRNTYVVCRMFWTNDAVRSDVCWGTLNPEYNFLQVAPVLVTPTLLERMRDNFMVVELWDKKASSENDKLIGMVKLSLHQFYLSFRERKIANALLKSEYPVMAIDNYIPVVDPFSGLHFGQLKVVLAMGSESQIANLQRLVLGLEAKEPAPLKPMYLERQDLLKDGGSLSGRLVEHQFEIVVEGLRGLKLFENMIWGEADCFVQFFFPAEGKEGDKGESTPSFNSIPNMKCFRTATTLCIPDPTFHDVSRHKMTLAPAVPVQRVLLTACANSGGGVTGLPFEVWCRYYHPNVRDQLIAKCTLPLAKLCAMITMHKSNEACVQSFALRLSEVGAEGQEHNAELSAKSKAAGVLDVTVNYQCQPVVSESAVMTVNRNHGGSHVCLSVGIIRAAGLKAAADSIALLDSSMAYPASVGVNAYVRIRISFLGKENERMTKTVARSFAPEFAHWMDFPCPLLVPQTSSSETTSLAELLESAEVLFEIWHQIPTGLPNKDFYVEKDKTGLAARRLAHQTGDVLLGSAAVPLVSLLTRRMGINGWFPVSLPSLGWTRPVDDDDDVQNSTALDQVVGGLELSIKFAHQDDREHVISVARSVGWSPVDVDVEQADWQDEDSQHNVHGITVTVEQASFPLSSALVTGHQDVDPLTKCYVRYKFYDKGAVISRSKKLQIAEGHLFCSLDHKHTFMLPHTAPLQWYLREERLEVQVWLAYTHSQSEKKPRKRDRLIGSCYIDLESLINMRRKQQRISGLFPLFKPGACDLRTAFVKAHVVSRVSASPTEQTSENEKAINDSEVSVSGSETDQSSSDFLHQSSGDFNINKSPRKQTKHGSDPEASFTVILAVERAMHLPLVTERNRSGEISPTTYVSFQSVERTKPTCSNIFPNSVNPVWDYAVETRLSTEYLYKENKNLVLKVWHKPSDAPKAPDKSCDRVLGFVSVDLTSFTKGFQQICGWYNIMNFNGQCKGQIKVNITPVDLQSVLPTGSAASSSLLMPSLIPHARPSLDTAAVASSIAQQLATLQQQVIQRMGSLTNHSVGSLSHQSVVPASVDAGHAQHGAPVKDILTEPVSNMTTCFWQPQFVVDTRTDDPSKSYLISSLHRQLQDLDTMTQRLKNRLAAPTQNADASQKLLDASHSGDILTGTHSDLSTIHTASMLMNTRDSSEPNPFVFSFEVGTSQESARSGTINNSSGMGNDTDSGRVIKDTGSSRSHGLVDSGIFSAKNYSEKSAETARPCQSSDKNGSTAATVDGPTSLLLGAASAGALEARFLTLAATDEQTLQSIVENSESCGNSHGFVPRGQRSTMTESSTRKLDHVTNGSNGNSSGGAESVLKMVESNSGSGSARSQEKIAEEKVVMEGYVSSNEEDEEEEIQNGGYGNFHRYRQMLDEKESDTDGSDDDDEEGEVVEIIPRNLNNISIVLALGDVMESEAGQVQGGNVLRPDIGNKRDVASMVQNPDSLKTSPASPNVNLLEGTSVWCSEDNDESFFQQVFERNTRLLVQDGEHVDEKTLNAWFQERSPNASKTRLESWLEGHHRMETSNRPAADNGRYNEFVLPGSHEDDGVSQYNDHSVDKDNVTEISTPREEMGHQVKEDMFILNDSSDHDGENCGEINAKIVTQNSTNASRVKTPRHLGTDQPSWDDHSADQDTDIVVELKDLQHADISGGGSSSRSSSSNSKKALPNTELQDLAKGLPQEGNAVLLTHSDSKPGQTAHRSDINHLTAQSAFSETSSLPSNQVTNDVLPPEFEHTSSHNQYAAQGARPKLRNLLSNVELDSNSSLRPHSETSQDSNTSTGSQNSGPQISQKSKTTYLNSDKNVDKRSTSKETAVSEKCGQTNNSVFDQLGIKTSAEPKGDFHEDVLTLDSAYDYRNPSEVASSQPNTLVMVNGVFSSPEDSTPEASDPGSEGINGNHTKDTFKSIIPNFFMSEKDMQASIKALKMATAAAKNEDKVRAENKVKAVSELVSKMASSKTKSSSVSIKNKQPPSAEEAKRIAKIFSSKMS
ncbi:hypothetical protein BsWGS_18088 [Bradybaena similaris]